MKKIGYWVCATLLIAGLGTAGPALAEPSYEETVAYIQGITQGVFFEQERCSFTYQFFGLPSRFQAGALISKPDGANQNNVRFGCANRAQCVAGEKKSKSYIALDATDEQGASLAKAMSRLITLCGGPAKD